MRMNISFSLLLPASTTVASELKQCKFYCWNLSENFLFVVWLIFLPWRFCQSSIMLSYLDNIFGYKRYSSGLFWIIKPLCVELVACFGSFCKHYIYNSTMLLIDNIIYSYQNQHCFNFSHSVRYLCNIAFTPSPSNRQGNYRQDVVV